MPLDEARTIKLECKGKEMEIVYLVLATVSTLVLAPIAVVMFGAIGFVAFKVFKHFISGIYYGRL
jgi:hypothetical protein